MAVRGNLKVISCSLEKTASGNPYLSLTVRQSNDLGGNVLQAKAWQEALIFVEKLETTNNRKHIPEVGNIISASWDEGTWQGKPQYILKSWRILEVDEALKSQFREDYCIPVDAAIDYYFHWNHWSVPFKNLMASVWQEFQEMGYDKILTEIPAGASNHHSRRGGLLQHIGEMIEIAERILGVHVDSEGNIAQKPMTGFDSRLVNFEILRAAIIFHDIGKIHDYSPETLGWDQNYEGALFAHSQWGMNLVERNWRDLSDESIKLKLSLQHAILTHHGKSIAPTPPVTPEASLIHYIDGISAAMDVHRVALSNTLLGKKPERNGFMGGTPVVLFPKHETQSEQL